eukprot:SAG11_NODE_2937_length_2824_cov_1.679633_1_plen_126_part_00
MQSLTAAVVAAVVLITSVVAGASAPSPPVHASVDLCARHALLTQQQPAHSKEPEPPCQSYRNPVNHTENHTEIAVMTVSSATPEQTNFVKFWQASVGSGHAALGSCGGSLPRHFTACVFVSSLFL